MVHADGAYKLQDGPPQAAFADSSELRNRRAVVRKTYLDHQEILLNWLSRILGEREAARDIAQASFLNLWIYAARGPIRRPKSLLYKTARNLAMNELRRRRRFCKRNIMSSEFFDIDPLLNAASHDPSPEDFASLRQKNELILQVINEMPERQRTAFKLHRFNKLSYKEIAAKIGVSESSVGKYIMEAVKSLRRALL